MTRGLAHKSFCRFMRFAKDRAGAAMVEFGLVVIVFFFILFAIIDMARLANMFVVADNMARIAVRTAVVRAPACAGLPDRHTRGALTTPRFGSSCSSAAGTCASFATVTCVGDATNATANEVWTRIAPLLPNTSVIADLQFTYSFDANLGFLGGPLTPMVTVDLDVRNFPFASPLGAMATAAGSAGVTLGATLNLPTFSASLPGEDLALGTAG